MRLSYSAPRIHICRSKRFRYRAGICARARWTTLSCFLLLFSSASVSASNQIIAVRGTNSVIVATATGELLRWDQGSTKPQWRVDLSGIKSGPGSPIALMAQLRDGDILVVERHGRILRINPADPTKFVAKAAMMQWLRLKVDIAEADPQKLRDQLMAIDAPGAAFLVPTFLGT